MNMNRTTRIMFFAIVVATRIHLSTGFAVTSSFTQKSTSIFGSSYSRRQYSKTTFSMGLQTAIVGMPNVGKV